MPLPERVIEPVSVCRGTLQLPVPDELEGVTNGSLANITRQLSTLSKHAEEMFGNLFKEAEFLALRGTNLQARIDKIAVKVTQLDSSVEEVTLQEIQLRKAFRSSNAFDQQVVSRETMPKSMLEQYLGCDKPPPLDKLNPYREDGKDGLKFYTDANYFFELWKSDMLQSTERAAEGKGRRGGLKSNRPDGSRQKKRVRLPHNTMERQRQKVLQDGEYIMYETPPQRQVSFHLPPETNGYGGVPGGYDPSDFEQTTPRNQQQGYFDNSGFGHAPGTADGGSPAPPPPQHHVRFEPASRVYTQEPIYTPRILREQAPGQDPMYGTYNPQQPPPPPPPAHQHSSTPPQHYSAIAAAAAAAAAENSFNSSGMPPMATPESPTDSVRSNGANGGTPQRRPSNPPPEPPPTSMNSTPTRGSASFGFGGQPANISRGGSSTRDSLPPPPPPPASEMSSLSLNGSLTTQHLISVSPTPPEPDLPPPPPVPTTTQADSLTPSRVPPAHMAPSPPPPPEPTPAVSSAPPPPAPPPPPPPPPMIGLSAVTTNGVKEDLKIIQPNGGMAEVLKSIKLGQTPLRKAAPIKRNPVEDKRSDLLSAIRSGISLKKVEQKADQSRSAGLSDVASILARRVAFEVSDSDDGPSDSEYDSDEWGETEA